MEELTSRLQSHLSYLGHSLRPSLGLNASKGPRPVTKQKKTERPRRKWQAIQDEEIQKGKRLCLQNWAKRLEHLDDLSASNPEILKALDIKECLLEVQAALLGRLAAEENHIKGLVKNFEPSNIKFDECVRDERVREVEEAIQAMQY